MKIKALGGEGRLSLRAVEPGALPGDGGAVLSLPAAGKAPRLHSPQREAARQGFYLHTSGCGKKSLFCGDVIKAGEIINGTSESKGNL